MVVTMDRQDLILLLEREFQGSPPDLLVDAIRKINGWLGRGDGVAVYRNELIEMSESNLARPHLQFVSYGSPEAQLEVQEPPVRLPDIGGSINWRYQLMGTYKGPKLYLATDEERAVEKAEAEDLTSRYRKARAEDIRKDDYTFTDDDNGPGDWECRECGASTRATPWEVGPTGRRVPGLPAFPNHDPGCPLGHEQEVAEDAALEAHRAEIEGPRGSDGYNPPNIPAYGTGE